MKRNDEINKDVQIDIDKMIAMLEAFERLDMPPERELSFLEIMRIDNKEIINSRLLGFFFNTTEAHGLNDLFLNALYNCLGDNKGVALKTKTVELEVATEKSKNIKSRIDILIDTYDELIVIENKLYHHARDNDFKSYIEHTKQMVLEESKNKLRRHIRYILLGFDNDEDRHKDFIFISHFELIAQIQKLIGDYIITANQSYIPLLINYLNAIEYHNPNSKTGKMEKSIVNFFGENHQQLAKIFEARQFFIEDSKIKLLEIKSLLKVEGYDIFSHAEEIDNVAEDSPEKYWLGYQYSTHDVEKHRTVNTHGIKYDFRLERFSAGFYLSVNFVGNTSNRIKAPEDCLQKLEAILDNLGIHYSPTVGFDDDAEYIHIHRLSWNDSAEQIFNTILPTIQKIQDNLNLPIEAE